MKSILKSIIPPFLLDWYHLSLAFLSALWYRFPSRRLILIGVTGTNGKSTTSEMIFRILQEAGHTAALLSSIHFQIGEQDERNTLKMTMPGRFFIQRFLRKAVDRGCMYAVLEVTSEGILQHRHRFLDFHTAVFTNISPEHIERHGSFKNYMESKGKLFKAATHTHVVNGDDDRSNYFFQFPAQEQYLYANADASQSRNVSSDPTTRIVEARGIYVQSDGIRFLVGDTIFMLNLLGKFQVYNALAAICVALSQNISLETCKKALESLHGISGRMEVIAREPFLVIVDYAFTPVALEQVYQTFSAPRICLLGAAGGGRDLWKRPELGKIAASYCKNVIITNEDPYDEDPNMIMDQVAKGAYDHGGALVEVIEDRREAIRRTLTLAHAGDTVIITGKGSEDSIAISQDRKIPWDDRVVVREELKTILDRGSFS